MAQISPSFIKGRFPKNFYLKKILDYIIKNKYTNLLEHLSKKLK
jgi:hypothetical protein